MRLRAIRRLQEAFFPLDAIAAELEGRPLVEIERIAEGKVTLPSAPPSGTTAERDAPTASATLDEDPRLAIMREASRIFRRIELFPGVDLTVADDAPEQSVHGAQATNAVAALLGAIEAAPKLDPNLAELALAALWLLSTGPRTRLAIEDAASRRAGLEALTALLRHDDDGVRAHVERIAPV